MDQPFYKCYDNGCPEREECLRWVERTKENRTSFSMFPYDFDIGMKCPNKIKVENNGEN